MSSKKKTKPRHLGRGLQSLLGPITEAADTQSLEQFYYEYQVEYCEDLTEDELVEYAEDYLEDFNIKDYSE